MREDQEAELTDRMGRAMSRKGVLLLGLESFRFRNARRSEERSINELPC